MVLPTLPRSASRRDEGDGFLRVTVGTEQLTLRQFLGDSFPGVGPDSMLPLYRGVDMIELKFLCRATLGALAPE